MSSASPRERLREWAAVGGAFLALALVGTVWLAADRRPPEWDHANHLERVVVCAQDLARGDVRAILQRSSFYPPLVPCSAALLYRLAPSDATAAQAVILAFLGVGMAAVYLLGRRLAGGAVGVAAALLFGSAPFVVFSSLRFQLDLPLASLVAVALLALLGTEGFSHRRRSLLAGLVFGLGMLTKPPFAAYLLPAVALVAVQVKSRRPATNGALALLVAAALSLPWYGPRLLGLPLQIANRSFKQAAESGHLDPLSWAALSLYPTWFVPVFGAMGVLLFGIGCVVCVRRRQWFVLVTLLVPFAVFELIRNKNFRYLLPLLPVVAVVAGVGFDALRGRARALAALALVVVAAVQVSASAFGVPWPGAHLPLTGVPWVFATPPTSADWHHRDILGLIARASGGAPVTVSVVPNYALFSVSNFRYYALRDGRPFEFTRAWDDEPVGIEYMILKTGDVGPAWTAEKPRRIAARLRDDPYLGRVFPLIGEFGLPDGSTATVRARRVPAGLEATPHALARALEAAVRRRVPEVARDVDGLEVRLAYDDGILRGRVRRLEITAAGATVAEYRRRDAARLRLRDVRIVVDDLLANPLSAWGAGRFDPLDARELRIEQATIGAADLQDFLRGLRQFRHVDVRLGDGVADFVVGQRGPDVGARVRFVATTDRPFALVAEAARIGRIPVPAALVNWVVGNYDPAPRIASRLPIHVRVAPIRVTPEAIRISEAR